MEKETFGALFKVDTHPPVIWPKNIPLPIIGDEVSGQIEALVFMAKVTGREWSVSPGKDGKPEATVIITAKSPPLEPTRQTSVSPLRI